MLKETSNLKIFREREERERERKREKKQENKSERKKEVCPSFFLFFSVFIRSNLMGFFLENLFFVTTGASVPGPDLEHPAEGIQLQRDPQP